jgi:hypothetical protein
MAQSDNCQPVTTDAHSIRDLRRIKWHWHKFLAEFFGFPLWISFHLSSMLIIWGMNNRPVYGCSSGTWSFSASMNNIQHLLCRFPLKWLSSQEEHSNP